MVTRIHEYRTADYVEYNRELIDNDMGTFHICVDLEGAKKELYSIESYSLARQVYIDILGSEDKDNNTTNGDHMRFKNST